MLRSISTYEIDKDINKQYNEYILKPINDKESFDFLAKDAGIKKMFKGEKFYHAVALDDFLGRKAFFNLIATIDDKIYKIYFKFVDDDRSECMSFRKEIREYINENMPNLEVTPKITKIKNGSISIWNFDWGNILLEEMGILTEIGSVWSTAIAITSKAARSAEKINFFTWFRAYLNKLFNWCC
jgi:hypothetical protein